MTAEKVIDLYPRDVTNISDVVCIVDRRGRGAVGVYANAAGRACLQRIFPAFRPSWESSAGKMPDDWLKAVFYVAELARGEHALPPIYGDAVLEEATPEAIAYLLAHAVREHGARAMIWNNETHQVQ